VSTFDSDGVGTPARARAKPVRFTIDTEGDTVTHDRVFFRRTPAGYVCVALGPPARFLRFAFDDEGETPFFGACREYARALETGELMPTQVPGGPFSLAKFDDAPLRRLAVAAALVKAGYDPDESRDERGRWSHEGGHGGDGFVSPLFFQQPGLPPPPVPVRAPTPPVPAAPPAESLLETTSRLALRALSFLLRRASGPIAFLSTILIPTNRGLIQEGELPDHPDLSYRYDEGEGRLDIFRTDADGKHIVYSGQYPQNKIFRDAQGRAVARIVDGGLVVDPDTIPGSEPSRDTKEREPKLCPDPGPDQPGGQRGYAYQAYIGWLNNGVSLPPGLAMNLLNPTTGNLVHFDDCRWSDGTMLEAKGPNYTRVLAQGPSSKAVRNLVERFLAQATAQIAAAGPRAIEWHFAEKKVADFARNLFGRNGLNISVYYTPYVRWSE